MKKYEISAQKERLLALANELSRKHWGIDYTGTLRLVNYDWKWYNGLFRWNKDTGLQEIRMSAVRNSKRKPEEVEGTLLHELVHWRLFTLGLPSSDHDYEFIAECLRVGAPISHAKTAQDAYKRFMVMRAFEERTDRKFNEAV